MNTSNWQNDPKFGFAEEADVLPTKLETLLTEIACIVDRDSMQTKGKWTIFELSGNYFPRDINAALNNARKAGFRVFHDKGNEIVGVLTEQI